MMRCVFMALWFTATLCAATITPTSYAMRNGDGQASSGSFNYWDLAYSGTQYKRGRAHFPAAWAT